MSHIQDTGPILFIDLLRGAAPPGRRKPYTRPVAVDVGTLDDLVRLRDAFARFAHNLARLALNADWIREHIPAGDRGRQLGQDLAALELLFRQLHVPPHSFLEEAHDD